MKAKDALSWTGPIDGPWPTAYVGGDLERAESEWLLANDIGTYAMSTLSLMHMRRHHGLLVTYLGNDPRRYVVLSHLEMTLQYGGRTHHLSTHQFPNVAPTLGYRHLETFTQDPVPRWVYRLPAGTVERTVSLVPGKRAVVIALTWAGKGPARLSLRPLMPMRPSDELCREHGGMLQRVVLRAGEVEVQPQQGLPPVRFEHSGIFMGSPDWWRKFEYLSDRGRYVEFQEDMWSPGMFEIQIEPRKTVYLVVSVGKAPGGPASQLVLDAAQQQLARDPGSALAPEVRALSVAVETFVLRDGEAIVAGYPWLDVWSRDTVLAIRGTYLARGDVRRAKKTLRGLLAALEDGLLPRRLSYQTYDAHRCVDATLWLFDVGFSVHQADPGDEPFLAELLVALKSVFLRIIEGPPQLMWLTPEGLLENGASYPLTWMDSGSTEQIHTPRWGLAVELQALFYRACVVLADLAEGQSDHETADRARFHQARLREAFRARFWCHETNFPFDCISGHVDRADTWADPAVRPNALIALAVAPDLFEPWQRQEILARVADRLLTPRGIRTLDAADPRYRGHAGGTLSERSAAGHQGAVWPHLLLYYVKASLHEAGDPAELRALIQEVLRGGLALGHVAQNADGDPPHRRRGSPAYAKATALLLEALVLELGVGVEGRTLW